MLVRDMDLDVPDWRRWLTDFLCGAQLAVDTTLVCALHAGGRPRREAAIQDGVALRAARRKKMATYPELVSPHKRVVLAVEVGGRWSDETRTFLSRLEGTCEDGDATDEASCGTSWENAVGSNVGVAKAVASSLLDLLDSHGGDGKTPVTHEVDTDHRYAGLSA